MRREAAKVENCRKDWPSMEEGEEMKGERRPAPSGDYLKGRKGGSRSKSRKMKKINY